MVAVAAVLRADMGVRDHGTDRIPALPVFRHPRRRQAQDLRRQTEHPDAAEQEEPVVADDASDVGGTGRGGPADPGVPRRQPPGRGPEADPAAKACFICRSACASLSRLSKWTRTR